MRDRGEQERERKIDISVVNEADRVLHREAQVDFNPASLDRAALMTRLEQLNKSYAIIKPEAEQLLGAAQTSQSQEGLTVIKAFIAVLEEQRAIMQELSRRVPAPTVSARSETKESKQGQARLQMLGSTPQPSASDAAPASSQTENKRSPGGMGGGSS